VVFIKDDAKVMADLLKTGHKMLSLSCPICNNPIFQKKNGENFCPVCNRKVMLVENTPEIKDEEKKSISTNKTEVDAIQKIILPVLKDKLQWIAQRLEKESQLSVISEYLELTFKILGLVDKINNIK
jgi:UPF0148 protein